MQFINYKLKLLRINMVFSVVSKGSLTSSENACLKHDLSLAEVMYTVTYFPCYSMQVHIFTEYKRLVCVI